MTVRPTTRLATIAALTLSAGLPSLARADDGRGGGAIILAAERVAATRAATQPTTLTAAPSTPTATKPTTRSARRGAATYPTAAELFRQMRDAKLADKAKAQVAVIDLSGGFDERASSAGRGMFGGGNPSFQELLDRLKKARADASLRAVVFTLGEGTALNLAQVQELRDAIGDLRKAQKRVFAYADSYDTQSYLLASAASDVCMLRAGEVFLPGLSLETMFYKGLLDKVGVKADYIQIGEFKGAEEPYTRTEPSPELKGELDRLTESLVAQVADGVSASRNLPATKVRALMDEALLPGDRAKQAGLVDHLTDIDGLRDLLKEQLGEEAKLIEDYGEAKGPDVDFSNPFSILSAMAQRPQETKLPKVAVIYAQGVITDGEGGEGGGILGGGERQVGGESMRRAFRLAVRDDNVKAIVVRIDSPGGSAMASEIMWQAMRRAAAQKPVVVSIGHMAASGGYYLASAGDTIYADPAAIVGSIGVVGGKVALGGLYEKLGLGVTAFSVGKNADIYSSTTEWTEQQRTLMRGWMRNTYDQFTDRIKTTRGDKIADIDKVARGRIFTAGEARALGMVDTLGGLNAAIAEAAKRAKLADGQYDLKALPPPPTIQEMLAGKAGATGMTAPKVSLDASAMLRVLPADARAGLVQSLQLGELMQRRPVVLMTPFVINVR